MSTACGDGEGLLAQPQSAGKQKDGTHGGFPSLDDSKGTWHHYGSMISVSSASELRQWKYASAVVDPVSSEHHTAAAKTPHRCPPAHLGLPNSPATLLIAVIFG